MTWLFLEANDVWLFRDGKPFSSGEGHYAQSIFPPSPMTIQGALRAHILAHEAIEWSTFREQSTPAARTLGQEIGTTKSLGQVALQGPFLARKEGTEIVRFVSMPADAVCDKDNNEEIIYALQPSRGTGVTFQTNWTEKNLLAPLWTDTIARPDNPPTACWLSDVALDIYFREGCTGFLRSNDFFQRESRFGMAMDYKKGRPQDQMLYQAEFIRPENSLDAPVGLLVHIDDAIPWSERAGQEGVISLGGEGHSARFQIIPDNHVVAHAGQQWDSTRIKFLLLTPAWFGGGWQPVNGNAGWSRLLGQSVRIVAAAVQRPQYIGGWDIARRWHKPMVACVPAGSVFFFESEQPDQPIVFKSTVLTETPEGHLPFDKQGFGLVAAGPWEWLDIS